MYCIKCGKVLPNNAKFCSGCGQKTGSGSSQSQPTSNSQTIPKPPSGNSRKSNTQYGQVIKCPACGGMINPFQTQCACGYVFRGTSTSTAVSDLAQELQDIDMKKGWKNKFINKYSAQIAVITNFTIPNLKEDLIEFALLVRANVSKIYADGLMDEENCLYKAWKTKFEECYAKAKMMLSSNDLVLFDTIEKEMEKYEEKERIKNSRVRRFSILGISLSAIFMLVFLVGEELSISCFVLSIFQLVAFSISLLLETKTIQVKINKLSLVVFIIGLVLLGINIYLMASV